MLGTTDRLRRGQWRLEDAEDGWILRVRPTARFAEVVPFVWSRNAPFVVIGTLFFLSWVTDWFDGGLGETFAYWWLALLALPFVALGVWLSWWLHPPPFFEEYMRANREFTVRAKGAKLDISGDLFDLDRLSTLRLTADNALGDRRLVVFTGGATPNAELVGWPGLPEAQATELMAAVAGRVGR